jgi:hypothetical protein
MTILTLEPCADEEGEDARGAATGRSESSSHLGTHDPSSEFRPAEACHLVPVHLHKDPTSPR